MTLVPLETQKVVLDNLRDRAREFAEASRSANTIRAYEGDLEAFCAWCRDRAVTCLPAGPEMVSLFVAWCAEQGLKAATIERRLAAISVAHGTAGYESPTGHAVVRAVLRGVRRVKGAKQAQKRALLVNDLRHLVAHVDDSRLIGLRDRALLLLGFASALRRSELVGLDVDDLRDEAEGVILTIHKSKTDQDARGQEVAVLKGKAPGTCPVRALQAWRDASGITNGPLFRGIDRHGNLRATRLTEQVVATIVKRYCGLAGFDPAEFGGHSLRAGFATSAARVGANEASIMRQTRHKSVIVARRYIRQGTRWDDHAGAKLGL